MTFDKNHRLDLCKAASHLKDISSHLKEVFKVTKDQRYLRAELMIEELGEVVMAMHELDEVELLDGLADLLYVTAGTATQLDVPLDAAFWEVHRSNMTKHKAAASHQGDKGKGADYSPPDISGLLKDWFGY
jgi:predicted HAD superfamily Cof-like phosphohydrolase